MNRSSWLASLIVVFSICFLVGPAFSATIGLRPSDPGLINPDGLIEVQVGQQFDLELYFDFADLDDFKGGNGLVAFSMTIDWDPLVKLLEVRLPFPPIWTTMDPSVDGSLLDLLDPSQDLLPTVPEKVSFNAYQFATPIAHDHILAYFTLECIGPGYTELTPHGTFDDLINFALDNYKYFDDQITFIPAKISQVPIPSTLLLLGGGLVGLLGVRRRVKRS